MVKRDLNAAAPTRFARFQRCSATGLLDVGDEYVVRMPGPWDGPVRVIDAGRARFGWRRWRAISRRARSNSGLGHDGHRQAAVRDRVVGAER